MNLDVGDSSSKIHTPGVLSGGGALEAKIPAVSTDLYANSTIPGVDTNSDFGRSSSKVKDQEVFEKLRDRILSVSLQMGAALVSRTTPNMQSFEKELAAANLELAPLLARYPDVGEALTKLTEQAVMDGAVMKFQADRIGIELERHLRHIRPNYQALVWTLLDKDQAQLQFIKEAFSDRFGKDLTETVKCKFKVDRSEIVVSLLAGQKEPAYAEALQAALSSGSNKVVYEEVKRLFTEIQNNLGVQGVKAVLLEHAKNYDIPAVSSDVMEKLQKRLPRDQFCCLEAIVQGDGLKLAVHELCIAFSHKIPNWSEIFKILEREREKLGLLLQDFAKTKGSDLWALMSINMYKDMENPRFQGILAILTNNALELEVSKIRAALLKMDNTWVGTFFSKQDPEEKFELIATYKELFARDFWHDLSKYCKRPNEYKLTKKFIEQGTVRPAEILYDCMTGFGTDVVGLKATLKTLTPDELNTAIKEYTNLYRKNTFFAVNPIDTFFDLAKCVKHWLSDPSESTLKTHLREKFVRPRDLICDIKSELDPDDEIDVLEVLRGKPKNAAEYLERLRGRYEHERSGFAKRYVDVFVSNGVILDRDFALAKDQSQQDLSNPNFSLLPGMTRLVNFGTLVENGLAPFRKSKHLIADVSANLISIGTTIGAASFAFSALGFSEAYLTVATVGFIASLLTRSGINLLVKGKSYGWERFLADTGYAITDGLFLNIAKALRFLGPAGRVIARNPLGRRLFKATGKFLLKSAVGKSSNLEAKRRSPFAAPLAEEDTRIEAPKDMVSKFDKILKNLSLYA